MIYFIIFCVLLILILWMIQQHKNLETEYYTNSIIAKLASKITNTNITDEDIDAAANMFSSAIGESANDIKQKLKKNPVTSILNILKQISDKYPNKTNKNNENN